MCTSLYCLFVELGAVFPSYDLVPKGLHVHVVWNCVFCLRCEYFWTEDALKQNFFFLLGVVNSLPFFLPFSGVYRIHIYASYLKNCFTFYIECISRFLTHIGLCVKYVVIYIFFAKNKISVLILNFTHEYIKSCQIINWNIFRLFRGNFIYLLIFFKKFSLFTLFVHIK